ncbi:MAG: extracellular solute-binding protein [Endomicrobiia bacterium]
MLRKISSVFTIYYLLFCSSCAPRKQHADLTIWHWMTDRENVFIELAKKYEKETGIKVKFELYAPSEIYSQKVRASAQTNTLPDIYGILGETRDFASFIRSGFVENLTEEMNANNEEWKKVFFSKALENNTFKPNNQYGIEPGIYGVPIDMMNIQMLYNKELFKKAGLDPEKPPRTWDEFVSYNRKLREANIPGLVSGFGEIWLIDCLANNYAFNIMGEEKFIKTLKGEIPYTDPDWLEVFKIFELMRVENILVKDSITMINKTAEQTFALNKAAFAFNGSWCINVYKGMNPNLNYAPMLPPIISKKFPMRIWGGAGSSFVVNAKSNRKTEAIKFLKWLTAKDQQVLLTQQTLNLPSNKESLTEIHPILRQFADDMDLITHPTIWPVNEFPEVIEAFDKGIQSILIGEKTPQQVATEVQKIKERKLKS